MRISHKYKFIWVSKPKTGSTAYRDLLDPYSDVFSEGQGSYYHHKTLLSIKKLFEEKNWDFTAYKKIVPVRNPYTLTPSMFTYGKPDFNGNYWWRKEYEPSKLITFEDWICRNETIEYLKKTHRLENYLFDFSGNDLSDFVFNAQKDEVLFKEFLYESCNLDIRNLSTKKLNSSNSNPALKLEIKNVMALPHVHDSISELFRYEIKRFDFKSPYIKT